MIKKKRRRPSEHYRRVRTKKGRRRVLINKGFVARAPRPKAKPTAKPSVLRTDFKLANVKGSSIEQFLQNMRTRNDPPERLFIEDPPAPLVPPITRWLENVEQGKVDLIPIARAKYKADKESSRIRAEKRAIQARADFEKQFKLPNMLDRITQLQKMPGKTSEDYDELELLKRATSKENVGLLRDRALREAAFQLNTDLLSVNVLSKQLREQGIAPTVFSLVRYGRVLDAANDPNSDTKKYQRILNEIGSPLSFHNLQQRMNPKKVAEAALEGAKLADDFVKNTTKAEIDMIKKNADYINNRYGPEQAQKYLKSKGIKEWGF